MSTESSVTHEAQ